MNKTQDQKKKAQAAVWKKASPVGKAVIVGFAIVPFLLLFMFVRSSGITEPLEDVIIPVENNGYDNSVVQVEQFLEKSLKDPDSYEGIAWGEVAKPDLEEYTYMVWHEYRAKNSFGGYVVSKEMFFLDSIGNIVDVKEVEF